MKDPCNIEPVVIRNTAQTTTSLDNVGHFVAAVTGSILGYTATEDLELVIYCGIISLGIYSIPQITQSIISYIKKPERELESIFDDY